MILIMASAGFIGADIVSYLVNKVVLNVSINLQKMF